MKLQLTLLIFTLTLFSCSSNNKDNVLATAPINLTFTHKWGNALVTNEDFNNIQFTNAYGNELSIERLRYLISKIQLTKASGDVTTLNEYTLVDLENESTLNFSSNQSVSLGEYTKVSFIFGFTNEDNGNGIYPELNSASWNVPAMLGGGYHYMQLDGKFVNSTGAQAGYNYHAIRAADNPGPSPSFPQDTFFEVNLGAITLSENTQINIEMDISQWFENPYLWDLNEYNQMLMPNSAAQILMFNNGQNVFNLVSVE